MSVGPIWHRLTNNADYRVFTNANEEIHALSGNDYIWGEGGNDWIYGNGGRDFLFGGAAADWIYGGSGDDQITGGDGNDHLYGGGGADDFVITPNNGWDTIYDFNPSVDELHFDNDFTSQANSYISGNDLIVYGSWGGVILDDFFG